MCVISVRGLSSLNAWCGALLVFLQLPLASQSVFANHFIAWRSFHSHLEAKGKKEKHFCSPFRSLEIISQPFWSLENHFTIKRPFSQQRGVSQLMEKIETFSQPLLKFGSHFVAILKLGDHFTIKRAFSQQMEDFPKGSYGAAKSFRSQRGVSQLILMPGAFS